MYKKSFYKYKYGYINIDQNNIYITSTGNWSETIQLTEKKFGKTKKRIGRVISIYFFFTIIILALLGSLILSYKNLLFKLLSLLTSVAGFLGIKRYFDTETGQRFFIPKTKIINIAINEDSIKLNFRTIDNKVEELKIHGFKGDTEAFKTEIETTT